MLNSLSAFLSTLVLHIIKFYYHFNKLMIFIIDNIISMFLLYLLKQLLNNVIFIVLITSLIFK